MAEFNINELKPVIERYGKELIQELVKLMISSDSVASGLTMKSLDFELNSAINQIVLDIYAEKSFIFIDQGRKAGKMPPISKIREWTTYRNISETAAYPIAKKIGKFGIPAKNLISRFLTDNKLKLEEKIEKRYSELVSKKLDEIINAK